jgi:hypothetical protein
VGIDLSMDEAGFVIVSQTQDRVPAVVQRGDAIVVRHTRAPDLAMVHSCCLYSCCSALYAALARFVTLVCGSQKVDGFDVRGMRASEVRALLAGPPGSQVEVHVRKSNMQVM